MEYLGYFTSVLIGVALGLVGGGGSILTVPVLVYIFNIDAALATVYSLFIVGITSAAGSVNYFRQGLVHFKTAAVFGLPSVIGVFIARLLIVPFIPEQVFSIGEWVVSKNMLLMVLFALLMLGASYSMITKNVVTNTTQKKAHFNNHALTIFQGLLTGTITGLVGAGGGFLIIPALVFILKMPMKEAIGTSLVIVVFNSLLGFASSIFNVAIHWQFLLVITAFAITGIFIGNFLSKKIDGTRLKPAFGWLVLLMGIYIITKEIFLNHN